MQCPNCGGTIPPNSTRCLKCGSFIDNAPAGQSSAPPPGNAPAQQPGPPAPPVSTGAPKSRVAAGVLGILLGGLGVHRFYLGYIGIGMTMLLLQILGWFLSFFCIGIFISIGIGVWGLVEGIMILTGSINTDASGQPLQ